MATKKDKRQTQVVIDYEGTEYTIEFNRRTAAMAEKMGFSLGEAQDGKLSQLPDLFYCGFMMHHPKMRRSTADEIFDLVGDKGELLGLLLELYAETVNSLFETKAEEGKALTWRAQ